VEEERVQLVWASAAEGALLAREINRIVAEIRELGPLNWQENWGEDFDVEAAVSCIAGEHAEVMEVTA